MFTSDFVYVTTKYTVDFPILLLLRVISVRGPCNSGVSFTVDSQNFDSVFPNMSNHRRVSKKVLGLVVTDFRK